MTERSNVLILGSGGREHALAWRAQQEGYTVHAAPGSDGIAQVAKCHAVKLNDLEGLIRLSESLKPEAILVGPEQPLVDGVADRLREAGFAVFGPGAQASKLEGSKAFAKSMMERHQIPTAKAVHCKDLESALSALEGMEAPPVVKASGLAAGKGVVVCETMQEAQAAIRACFVDGRFGQAGQEVLLESRLVGQEVSYFVLCDGERWLGLAPCQDHKRLLEGDQGPNTGGMGAYLPAPIADAEVCERIERQVVEPTVRALAADGLPYQGVIFIGLMIDPEGQPHVIEYNVRWGDPETQALMMGAQGALVRQMVAIAQGSWTPEPVSFSPSATVVMASGGYPETSTKGSPITGLDDSADACDSAASKVFHAGTRKGPEGWVSNGGRVLAVTASASSLKDAIDTAYTHISEIEMPGAQVRRDIGHRALS